jgi:alpha-L-rhamnosidase
MFRTLAGIDFPRSGSGSGSGYSGIKLRPSPPAPGSNAQHKPIDWVNASYDSIHGKIVSNWRVEGDRFRLKVEIPTNTFAVVHIPARDATCVTEGGKPLSDAEHVRFVAIAPDGRVMVRVESGRYRFESTGGIVPANVGLKTSKPADMSINPEKIDLTNARQLVHWDFRQDTHAAKWPTRHNLDIVKRDGKVLFVATGSDPQLATELPEPLTGPLAIELKARPAKGTSAQFFWASPSGGFNARQQNSRQLDPADQVNAYLFRIGDDQPLQKLRFDPFANQGELEIQTLTIYQLKNK